MRIAILAAALLLAGCVEQGYQPPAPIQLQPYGPAIPYRTIPAYRPPLAEPAPPPALAPVPMPLDAPAAPAPVAPATIDSDGAIPLQDMPAPAADNPAAPVAARPQEAAPAPAVQRNPTSGPGSNVPLEGFRPMHSQTRPTP